MKKKNRFVLILLFPILIFSFLSLPIWQIKKIEFQSENLILDENIENAFNFENENIFFFKRDKVSVGDFPQIKKIDFRRHLPSTLIVIFEKRTPFALCELNNPVLIDEDGVIVENGLNQNKNNLIVIRGLQEKEIESGRQLNSETFLLIRQIFANWNGISSKKIKKIDLSDKNSLEISLGNSKIKLGNNLRFFRKKISTQMLLADLNDEKKEIEYLDVSAPLSPAVKFKGTKI